MEFTIATPEGPYKSIVTVLEDRVDWPAWYDDVFDIAQTLGIWKFANPDSQDEVREPARPPMPTRPVLESTATREQYETDKTFDVRVERERHAHALAVSEYDILCEQYRVDSTRYVADLGEYGTRRDNLEKLYRIIYRSLHDRYRAYLKLDAAKTPRAMLRSLRSRIGTPSDKDRAQAALRRYNSTLQVQPADDKRVFIEAIAQATVELHRYKGDRFDEGTAVKDLLRALQVLDGDFADIWLKREGKRAVLDIVEDFKYKLGRQDGKGFLALQQRQQQQQQQKQQQRENNFAPSGKVLRAKSSFESVVRESAPTSTTAINGTHRGNDNGPDYDFLAPSRSDETKSWTEYSSHEDRSPLYWSEDHHSMPVEISNGNGNGKSRRDVVPPSPSESTFSRRDSRQAARNEHVDGSSSNGVSKKRDMVKNGGTSNSAPAVSKPDRHAPPPPSSTLSNNKAKKSSDVANLTWKTCPGCELNHLMRDDAWWENCYVYWHLKGLGNIPDNFHAQERRLDLVFSRLQDCADENRRAEKWASGNSGVQRKSGHGTADGQGQSNGNGNGNGNGQGKGHTNKKNNGNGNGNSNGNGNGQGNGHTNKKNNGNSNSNGNGKAAAHHDGAHHRPGSVTSTSKGKSKSKSQRKASFTSVQEFRPQSQHQHRTQTQEFNLW
ncbi:hypothetical protein E4U21_001313 [Claviceps maximensis]|nr:hypothetical protein E4U21_001313 [Claviceps maximensis]